MESKNLTDEEAATLLGVEQSTITKLRGRSRSASLALALDIERRTNGEVGAGELPLSKRNKLALKLLRPESGSPTETAA